MKNIQKKSYLEWSLEILSLEKQDVLTESSELDYGADPYDKSGNNWWEGSN